MQAMSKSEIHLAQKAMKPAFDLREKIIKYYTTGGRRFDDGINLIDDATIDNGTIKGYAGMEMFIKPEDEQKFLEETMKFLDVNKEEIEKTGLHSNFGKMIDESNPGYNTFIFFFELNGRDKDYPGDYSWFNTKISEAEVRAMETREKEKEKVGEFGNVNKRLFEEDDKERETRLNSTIAGRHI